MMRILNTYKKSPSKTLAYILAVFCFLSIGWTFIPHTTPSVSEVPSSAIRVSGIVSSEVERRIDQQRVVLDEVSYADSPREGKLLAWLPLYPQVHYGDSLVFNCLVQKPEAFDTFAYDKHLATKHIYAVCYQAQFIDVYPSAGQSISGYLLQMKSLLLKKLYSIVPEPHASFLSGLLFGGSSSLSPQLKESFRVTGMSHILAASGYNISLFSLTFLSFILGTPIGRRKGLMLTTLFIACYMVMAGASPAVIRAGIMGLLVVLEKWLSRKASFTNILLLTVSLMLLSNPYVIYDVGFQLSFVATIAILTLTQPMKKRCSFIPEFFGFREAFAGSLAAIVLTLPIILWHFGSVSVVAPIVNLLVLPLVPYAMMFTVVSLIFGSLISPLTSLFVFPAWAISHVILQIIHAFGMITFAAVSVESARIMALILSGLYLAFFVHWFYARKA